MELVIVDESFIDFAGDPMPSMLLAASQFFNSLIVRSMSNRKRSANHKVNQSLACCGEPAK